MRCVGDRKDEHLLSHVEVRGPAGSAHPEMPGRRLERRVRSQAMVSCTSSQQQRYAKEKYTKSPKVLQSKKKMS